jgi:hypothetical protein
MVSGWSETSQTVQGEEWASSPRYMEVVSDQRWHSLEVHCSSMAPR